MNFLKAFKAFWRVILEGGGCEHLQINLLQLPTICPDCKYQVKIQWILIFCQNCHAKRVPRKTSLGDIKPVFQFCRHCGQAEYQLVRKDRIEAYELVYAVCVKSTANVDEPVSHESPIQSPFYTSAQIEGQEIYEAEVVSKREYRGTKSAFKGSPFDWHKKQNPKRYGGLHFSPPEPYKLNPFQQLN